jgi:hypothetical protein
VTARSRNLERLGAFALLVNVDGLTWLHAEARTVDSLTVHQNVTVNNHLACLGDGASKAGTKNKRV